MTDLASDGPDEMGREIAGGPSAVAATLAEVDRLAPELAERLSMSRMTTLLGTGMSLALANAAAPAWRRARSLAGHQSPVTVRESTAAAFGSDDGREWQHRELVVAISKSGTSPETLAGARRAADAGAGVVAVTAAPSSPLAAVASLVVTTPIGEENGAGTKSGLAALAALLGMPGAMDPGPRARADLAASLGGVVESWSAVAALGDPLAAAERTWILGFGGGIGLAQGAAIMWHEKVRRPAVALSVSEFRHGPIEAARSGDAVIVVDPDEPVPARTAYLDRLRTELERLDVTPVWLAPEPPAGVRAVRLRRRPGPEASLESLLRLQQLARATAHAAGTYRDGFAVLREVVKPVTGL